jgi:hypothetical protein
MIPIREYNRNAGMRHLLLCPWNCDERKRQLDQKYRVLQVKRGNKYDRCITVGGKRTG